jgi:hypothetical protein
MQVARISLSMRPDLVPRIDKAARALDMSRSEFIARTVEAALEEGSAILSVLADNRARAAMFDAFSRPGVMGAVAAAMGQELGDADRQRVLSFMRPQSPSKSEAAPRRSRRSK